MINFKTIIRIIGILLLLETVMFLVCSGVSFYYREAICSISGKQEASQQG
mgnify:CR=1 FL=1